MNVEKLSQSKNLDELLSPSEVGLKTTQVVEAIKHPFNGKIVDLLV
jgi:hypothetical protein